MFSQDRKYFRFRFHRSRVLLLVFLLVSPSQAADSALKECVKVATAYEKNPIVVTLIQDRDFVINTLKCLQATLALLQETDWKTVQERIPTHVQDLIQRISILTEKANFATKEGLALLSVYLFHIRSTDLYHQAKNLDKYYNKHTREFDLLEKELKDIQTFIDTRIVPQWKNGDGASMLSNIGEVIEMLQRCGDVLSKLVQAICDDGKQDSSLSLFDLWASLRLRHFSSKPFYSACAVFVCICSFCTGNLVPIVGVCGLSVSICCYQNYLSQTLENLDLLRNNTAEMCTEIADYRVIFIGGRSRILNIEYRG